MAASDCSGFLEEFYLTSQCSFPGVSGLLGFLESFIGMKSCLMVLSGL